MPARFGIMPRHAKSVAEIRWFIGQSGVAFHTANAWEEDGTIKLIAGFSKRFTFFDPDGKDGKNSDLYEWTFDLATGKTVERVLECSQQDFFQINPSYTGMQNRYVWAVRFTGAASPFHSIDGLLKHDLKSGGTVSHQFV